MVDNWEIEWNDSMLRHGQDMGTVEFLIAKGGDLSDINYVLYGVQEDSWEPVIKAVAKRDNSHPDIIRKTYGMPGSTEEYGGFRPAVSAGGTAVAPNPRAAKQAVRAQRVGQAGQRVSDAEMAGNRASARDYRHAGLYGSAVRQKMSDMFGGGRQTGEPGMARRMGQTMRELPRAFMQSRRANADARDAQARRSRLEGGLASAEGARQQARDRYVEGSQGYSENMQRFAGRQNRDLARDFNVDIPTDADGNPTMTAEDAMRAEIQRIGEGATQARPGVLDRARQMAERRRAEKRGDAFRPDQVVEQPEQPEQPEEPMPEAPSPEVAERERADAPVEPETLDIGNITMPEEAPPPETQAGPPTPAPAETATATEAEDPRMRDIRTYLTSDAGRKKGQYYGKKTIGPKGSQAELPQRMFDAGFDPGNTEMKITQEMLDAFQLNPKSPQGRYFMQSLQNDSRFQQAVAAGDEEKAKEVAEEKAEKLDVGDISVGEGDAFDLKASEDKHEASWDSLLKGLNIRG